MNYFTFDCETTGLEPGSRLVELSSIAMNEAGEEIDRFDRLVDPGMPLPADVITVHGLTNADLAGKGEAEEVLAEWQHWIRSLAPEQTGIAHFAPYDMGVLSWEMGRVGISLPSFSVVDTCAMAKIHGVTPNNKLQTLVEHHGITRIGDAHRARSDADACRQVFNLLRANGVPITSNPWSSEHQYIGDLPAAFKSLPELVATGGRLEFHYTDAKGAETTRRITPYGWAAKADGVYFHGLCHEKGERRTFRTDRAVPIPF